jgi:Kef-type K+ transport system membrane component KefB
MVKKILGMATREQITFLLVTCIVAAVFLTFESFALQKHDGIDFPQTILWIAVLLLFARIGGFIKRWGQPRLIGEVIMGIILGNLILFGIPWFEGIQENEIITFLAEFGVVLLLFQAGLESNLEGMRKTGFRAILVACAGAVFPFILGAFVAAPLLLPNEPFTTHLFIGAALTATSVGIAATLFKQYGRIQSKEAQIVLGAAVMDDVLGMVLLPVLMAMVTASAITAWLIGSMALQAIVFLFGSVILGRIAAPHISRFFSLIDSGSGMKFTIAISTCLIFASLAGQIGIAPIIGAFAAGLFLDPVHFNTFRTRKTQRELNALAEKLSPEDRDMVKATIHHYEDHEVEDLIDPLARLMVPLFFITIGMAVDIPLLLNPVTILIALTILAVAVIARMAAALFAGKDANRALVGVSLIPNGEVGLVYAALGRELGVVNNEVFAIIITVMVLSTILAPLVLNWMLKNPDLEIRLPILRRS